MANGLNENKKVRLNYFLPQAVLTEIKERMIGQGYDLKGKSRWISEAVQSLLTFENYSELVHLSDQMQGFQKLDSVSVDKTLKSELDNAVIEIRKQFPAIEGVQSRILRTAILQRLIRQM